MCGIFKSNYEVIMNKIIKPKISKEIVTSNLNEVLEDEVSSAYFESTKLLNRIKNITFNGCVFKNVDFNKDLFTNVDLVDCVFDSCDLSGIDIDSKLFLRCEFINCLLIGANLTNVIIKSVAFKHSNLEYVNVSSECKNVFLANYKKPS